MLKLLRYIALKIAIPFFVLYNRLLRTCIQQAAGAAIVHSIKNVGKDLRIHGHCTIIAAKRLVIGDYVRVGKDCHFNCLGGVTIGDNTQISRNVVIYSSNHDYNGTAIPYDSAYIYKPVVIGKSVWIGMGVMILPGVEIGDGAIVGMGTVVSKNIGPGEIIVGAAQRKVGNRDADNYQLLEINQKYFGLLYPDN